MAKNPTDEVVDEFLSGQESDDLRRVKKPVGTSDEKSASSQQESYNDTLHYGDNASDSDLEKESDRDSSARSTKSEEQGSGSPAASEDQVFGSTAESGSQPNDEIFGLVEPDPENQGGSAPQSDPADLNRSSGAARGPEEADQRSAEFIGRADNTPVDQSDPNPTPNHTGGQKAGADSSAGGELEDEKPNAAQSGAYRADAGEAPSENAQENPPEVPTHGDADNIPDTERLSDQAQSEPTAGNPKQGDDSSEAGPAELFASSSPPEAVDDLAAVDQGGVVSIDVLTNDSDPDATDTLTITAATLSSGNGSVSVVDSELQYDAGSDYDYLADGETAQVTVEYTVDDGNGGADIATATITVTGSNDGPMAVADVGTIDEGKQVVLHVLKNDTDPDVSDTLSISQANIDSGLGSVKIVGQGIKYDPMSDYDYLAEGETAEVVISYIVDDGNGGTDTATATVTVTGSNHGPTAVADTGSVGEDTTVTIDVLANDADADADATDNLSITAANVTGGGSVSIVDGELQYDPGSDYNHLADGESAQVTVEYMVDDGNGGTDTATAAITVTGSNDGPTAVADTGSVNEGSTVTIDVLANDSDPDTIDNPTLTTANITGGSGSVSIVGNELQYDAGSDYDYLADGETAQVTVEYTMDDGNGGTDTATATITVTGTADAITGTSGDDKIHGTSGGDTIIGLDGKDDLKGKDGDDTLFGGDGDDKVKGEDGDDTLFGDAGDDDVKGGEGDDSVYGGDGDDKVKGEDGDDILFGDAGDAELKGGDGDDTLTGGDGSDTFVYKDGEGSDIVDGGAGGGWTDTIELKDFEDATVGDDWTITFDTGGIDAQGGDYMDLMEDSSGTITLEDGGEITFEGIERVEW